MQSFSSRPVVGGGRERDIQPASRVATEPNHRNETWEHRNSAPRAARGKGHRLWRVEKAPLQARRRENALPDFDHRHVCDRPNSVRLDIVDREGDGAARLQLFAPVGMYLQKPVKVTVDQG